MRVAVASDTFLPQVNGVTIILDKMRIHMRDYGVECRFLVPAAGNSNSRDQEVIPLPSRNFVLYPECQVVLPAYRRLRISLERFRPQLIHLITPFSMGLMGLKYARSHAIPVVASYHTNFPGFLHCYNLQALEKAMWRYLRWFHSFSRINLCPSQETMNQLYQQGITNLQLWSSGIDTEEFAPHYYNEDLRRRLSPDGRPVLLYVGRLAPEKDVEVLMQTADILNRQRLPFTLVLVGDGPWRQRLEGMKRENVVFTGYRYGLELRQLYASSDLFLFPSRNETCGNVVLEAMASGLPVVGADCGGIKENLIPMHNGIFFPAGEARGMAEATAYLIANPDMRREMGKRARQHAANKSWTQVFSDLAGIYETVLSTPAKITRLPA